MKPDKTRISIADFTAYFGFGTNVIKFFEAINNSEKLEVHERTNHGDFSVIVVSKLREEVE